MLENLSVEMGRFPSPPIFSPEDLAILLIRDYGIEAITLLCKDIGADDLANLYDIAATGKFEMHFAKSAKIQFQFAVQIEHADGFNGISAYF